MLSSVLLSPFVQRVLHMPNSATAKKLLVLVTYKSWNIVQNHNVCSSCVEKTLWRHLIVAPAEGEDNFNTFRKCITQEKKVVSLERSTKINM